MIGKTFTSVSMVLALSAVGLCTTPFLLHAQAAPQGPANASSEDSSLGEIVVTAQRRSELARDVPISITSIGATEIEQANVQQLSDIQKLTPSLRFDTYGGGLIQPTIRGVGTTLTTGGSGSNVGVYVDGFYSPNPAAADFDLLNVENIQVLKGPQGTLFGRNTTGGAIVVSTAKPSTDTQVEAQAGYESYNTQRYQGYATFGLADNLAMDVEGIYRRGDGFQRSIYLNDQYPGFYENATFRTGIKYDPTDKLSFLLRYSHAKTDDPTSLVGGAYIGPNGPASVTLLPAVVGIVGPSVVATSPNDESSGLHQFLHKDSDIGQLTSTLELPFGTVTSYSQYRKEGSTTLQDLDYGSSPVFSLILPIIDTTVTQEFLLTSAPGSKLQWTTGLFYFDYTDHYNFVQSGAFGAPIAPFAGSSTEDRSGAAYFDATYEVVNNFFITAGARYSHDEVGNNYFLTQNTDKSFTKVDAPTLVENRVSPRIVFRYKPDESSSVYASFSRGFKPGLVNVGGGTLNNIIVQPESINAYEVGYKYGHAGLSAELSTFYYDYGNLQVNSFLNGASSLVLNAATSHIKGVEGNLRYDTSFGLSFDAAASYTDAKYVSFPAAPYYDLNSQFLYSIVSKSATGNEMQRAPKLTGTLNAHYAQGLGSAGKATLSASFYHTSKIYFDAGDEFSQNGYNTLGLRLEWNDINNKYGVAVYGDNVFDARYKTTVFPETFGIGTVWSAPTTIGVAGRVKF